MTTEKQLTAEARLRGINALTEESIWNINNSRQDTKLMMTLLSNLVSLRVLSGALKQDIKLLAGEQAEKNDTVSSADYEKQEFNTRRCDE